MIIKPFNVSELLSEASFRFSLMNIELIALLRELDVSTFQQSVHFPKCQFQHIPPRAISAFLCTTQNTHTSGQG